MKHYTCRQSRGEGTEWMLRELGVPYQRVEVDIQNGEQQTDAYRAINPMGKIPALEDDGVIVTESAAICAYLADKYIERGMAPTLGSPDRGRYMRLMFFPGTTLEPLLSVLALGVEELNSFTMGWGDLPRALAAVESLTPASDWALGEQFTAADVVFGGALAFFSGFKMLDPSPRVQAYVDRLEARPAYQETHGAGAG